jgi:hypothetical protein
MTNRKIQVVRDTSGILREYELDNSGINITQDGLIVTDKVDNRTRTKRVR